MAYTQKEVQNILILMHGVTNSYRRLSDGDSSIFSGIPPGTLSDIATTGKVPKRWRKQLNCRPPRPSRIAISKKNMVSACNSIVNNISARRVLSLYILLGKVLEKEKDNEEQTGSK